MRSRIEEVAAFKEISQRTQLSTPQESRDEAIEAGVPKEALNTIKPTDGKEQGAICMLLRERLILPQNKTGPCVDCGETIQWRPHIPEELEKLCAFCALQRIRGDA